MAGHRAKAATLLVIFLSSFWAVSASAQALQLSRQMPADAVAASTPESLSSYQQAIEQLEYDHGVYDSRLIEALQGLGAQLLLADDPLAAREVYSRALQISRINDGLYSETQVPIIERIIDIDLDLENWDAVDRQYAYLENLFGKLYTTDDPRLEKSLRKLVAWHLDASNVNLEGKRLDHLRSLNRLYKLRLAVTLNTLGPDDPMSQFLTRRVALSQYHLYAHTGVANERRRQEFYSLRERYLLTLE